MSRGRGAEPSPSAIVRPVAECRQVVGVCYSLDGRSRQRGAGVACCLIAVALEAPIFTTKEEMSVAQMDAGSASCLLGGGLIPGRTITR